ncbi:MAG TPA: NAD-binding protein, partial [Candidatus Cloacimonadota bacterium]|nr:NAD-binding protein [Candidatus Cloacimonadota bacterium]
MRIVIAGTGIAVYFLAKRFISKGYNISIISDNLPDSEYYSRNLKALVIFGEFSDAEILDQAKAHSAEIFIGMTA